MSRKSDIKIEIIETQIIAINIAGPLSTIFSILFLAIKRRVIS